jgi:hypothetical protein
LIVHIGRHRHRNDTVSGLREFNAKLTAEEVRLRSMGQQDSIREFENRSGTSAHVTPSPAKLCKPGRVGNDLRENTVKPSTTLAVISVERMIEGTEQQLGPGFLASLRKISPVETTLDVEKMHSIARLGTHLSRASSQPNLPTGLCTKPRRLFHLELISSKPSSPGTTANQPDGHLKLSINRAATPAPPETTAPYSRPSH